VALPGVEGDTACESLDAGGRHGANTSQFSALLAKEERFETRALCLTTVFLPIKVASRMGAHPFEINYGVIPQRGCAWSYP
jgi:hypothetical protein